MQRNSLSGHITQPTVRPSSSVHPAHRRQGIARALLHALEGLAGDAGRSRVLLNTLATQLGAQGLYESQGYRKFGEGEPDGFSVFMYRKDLRATPQR